MPSVPTLLNTLAAILLAHAAYSTLHFRSLVQDLGGGGGDDGSSGLLFLLPSIPPLDVYIELGMSFFLLLVGQLMEMGPLQSADVLSAHHHRTPLIAPAYRTRQFDLYTHLVTTSSSQATNKEL
jgi:Membrane magnesium transporter